MAKSPSVPKLLAKIAAVEAALASLRTELAAYEEIQKIEAAKPRPGRPSGGVSSSKRLEQVEKFFTDRRNRWATFAEIAAGAEMKESILRKLIYDRCARYFRRRDDPAMAGRKQFQLSGFAGQLAKEGKSL